MFINVSVVFNNIYSISNLLLMRIQQFNVQFNDNGELQIRPRKLSVPRCNQRVESQSSHHFRDCSP